MDEFFDLERNKAKRETIDTIYPEKLFRDRFKCQSARINEAGELINKLGEGYSENISGQTE